MEGAAGGAAAGGSVAAAAAAKEKSKDMGAPSEPTSPVSPTRPSVGAFSKDIGPGTAAGGAAAGGALINPFENSNNSEHSSPEEDSPLRGVDNGDGIGRQDFDAPPGAGLPPQGLRPGPARIPTVVSAGQDIRPPSRPSTEGAPSVGRGGGSAASRNTPSVETVPEEGRLTPSLGRTRVSQDGSGSRFREDM